MLGFIMALIATAALFTGGIPDATPRPVDAPTPTAAHLLAAPEGGWTWFNSPNAIYIDGKTHIGYISGDGHPMAAYYDHATETMSEPVRLYPSHTFQVDDHDDPGLLVRSSDGALLAYFAKHFADDQYINVWDGASWGGPANIGAAINAGTTTYMVPVELPSGTIRVFFRDHYDGVTPEWAYADSADGETFSGHVSLVREAGILNYLRVFMSADGRIDFVASGHPAYETGGSIWHFYWDDGSYYKSDGTLIESALPLDTGDMTEVYDGDTTKSWHWDIARIGTDLAIVFAIFPGNDGSEHRYQYARWTGSAWAIHEVADAGGYIPTTGSPLEVFYSGGIAIDRIDIDRVYYSSNAAGSFDIFRAITPNDGYTWSVSALTSDATKDIRPKAVRNADPSLRVVWMRGTYAKYTDWDTGTWGGS